MTEIRWTGSTDGSLQIMDSTCNSIGRLDDLVAFLNKNSEAFSAHGLRLLGSCAYFLALREASDNDPLLPAADRVMGAAFVTPHGIAESEAFQSGRKEFRDLVFEIRGSRPSDIVEVAHDQLGRILARPPTTTN